MGIPIKDCFFKVFVTELSQIYQKYSAQKFYSLRYKTEAKGYCQSLFIVEYVERIIHWVHSKDKNDDIDDDYNLCVKAHGPSAFNQVL